ncbi:MAG: pentapeptide repeat-containing protein [Chromatiales bacterium]|nr:pentapeptide repeat-containing protein [Chromatiales bacterium]
MKEQNSESPKAWFTRHEGVISGPVSEARIRRQLLEGLLNLTDQISLDQQEWLEIGKVPGVVPLQMRAESGDKAAIAKVEARAKQRTRERAREGRIPVVPLVVSVVVLAGVVLLSLLIGMPEKIDTPQCDHPPTPGVNWRNCLLLGIDAGSASLAGANLNSAVLRQGKFSATNLSGADLSYADLRKADLRYAQLVNSVLVGANFQGADLRDADLRNGDLRFADFKGARMDGVVLSGSRLDDAIWTDGRHCAEQSLGVCR